MRNFFSRCRQRLVGSLPGQSVKKADKSDFGERLLLLHLRALLIDFHLDQHTRPTRKIWAAFEVGSHGMRRLELPNLKSDLGCS